MKIKKILTVGSCFLSMLITTSCLHFSQTEQAILKPVTEKVAPDQVRIVFSLNLITKHDAPKAIIKDGDVVIGTLGSNGVLVWDRPGGLSNIKVVDIENKSLISSGLMFLRPGVTKNIEVAYNSSWHTIWTFPYNVDQTFFGKWTTDVPSVTTEMKTINKKIAADYLQELVLTTNKQNDNFKIQYSDRSFPRYSHLFGKYPIISAQ